MDVDSYLHRIGYTGSTKANAETLCALHRAHMFTVPFENLDIHLGRDIILDEERLFEKIVHQRRGGFCYELNGLFAALLRQLHFKVRMLSAGVYDGDKPGPEFDHMALLVQLEERWLADVGFGDSFVEPLRLDDRDEQLQRGVRYRVEQDAEIWKLMERKTDADWKITYQFDLQPRRLTDFADMCRWHQTAAESHFTQNKMCSLATPDGRITLSDMKLIITENGVRREQILANKKDHSDALKSYFEVEIT